MLLFLYHIQSSLSRGHETVTIMNYYCYYLMPLGSKFQIYISVNIVLSDLAKFQNARGASQ